MRNRNGLLKCHQIISQHIFSSLIRFQSQEPNNGASTFFMGSRLHVSKQTATWSLKSQHIPVVSLLGNSHVHFGSCNLTKFLTFSVLGVNSSLIFVSWQDEHPSSLEFASVKMQHFERNKDICLVMTHEETYINALINTNAIITRNRFLYQIVSQ